MIQDKEAKLRVSVVLATYNGSAYLVEQLQSLLNQTRQPDEVIIRDDASLDNTVEILRQFIGEHNLTWKIVEGKENQGYIGNFRKAMELSQGDVVFLCDQDDIWHPQKIEKMMAVMEENPHIEALASGYSLIDKDSAPFENEQKKFYVVPFWAGTLSKVNMGKVFYWNMAQGCACCYRCTLLERYCTTTQVCKLPHDWALNLLAYQRNALFFLNEELIQYRIHDNNATGLLSRKGTIQDRIPRLQEYLDCLSQVLELPISTENCEEFQAIISLHNLRVQFLQQKNLLDWWKGLIQYRNVLKQYFFLQYLKDFTIVLLDVRH